MIVFLDRQHAGKPDKISDRGASIEPSPEFGLGMEAIYTGYLSMMIEEKLLQMGAKVLSLSDGPYSDRHKRVNEYAKNFPAEKMAYLALHLNCGGGDYGSYFYFPGSEEGVRLAEIICHKMRERDLPKIVRHLPKASSPDDWTKNAYYTIRGVSKPVGICCEPLFMDTHREYLTLEKLREIATGIALALVEWGL